MNKNIALIGLSGVGKTSIGKELAKILNKNFIDIDKEIEKEEGMSISTLFENRGEAYFRKQEEKILNKYSKEENTLISTGGGIILSLKNRKILKNLWTIWLIRDISSILQEDLSNRPLLQDKNAIYKMEEERRKYYEEVAKIRIYNKDKEETIREIVRQYEEDYGHSWT